MKSAKRNRAREAISPNAIAFTIRDAQSMGAPGRTKIYDLAKRGKLKLIKFDGRTRIDGDSLRALLTGSGGPRADLTNKNSEVDAA